MPVAPFLYNPPAFHRDPLNTPFLSLSFPSLSCFLLPFSCILQLSFILTLLSIGILATDLSSPFPYLVPILFFLLYFIFSNRLIFLLFTISIIPFCFFLLLFSIPLIPSCLFLHLFFISQIPSRLFLDRFFNSQIPFPLFLLLFSIVLFSFSASLLKCLLLITWLACIYDKHVRKAWADYKCMSKTCIYSISGPIKMVYSTPPMLILMKQCQ